MIPFKNEIDLECQNGQKVTDYDNDNDKENILEQLYDIFEQDIVTDCKQNHSIKPKFLHLYHTLSPLFPLLILYSIGIL